LIAATNVDLAKAVEAGAFRADLFYRLRVLEIALPALEDRREDIGLLGAHFASRAAKEAGVSEKRIAPAALTALAARRWPGNVRELENAVRRAVVQARSDTLGPADFEAPPAPIGEVEQGSFEEMVRKRLAPFVTGMADAGHDSGDLHQTVLALVERPLIELVLKRTRGNRVRAAKLLGLNRNTLAARIKALAIEKKGEK
jgi:two-component system nitrogen regulation response regulator GlnG